MPVYSDDGTSYEDAHAHAAGHSMVEETATEGTKNPVRQPQVEQPEASKPMEKQPLKPWPDEGKVLYIIRHGKTDMNNETSTSQDHIRGWKDIPLNDEGRQEAHDTGDKLQGMEKPSVLHHSDLDRAEETAKIIGGKIGMESISSRELRPWDLGNLTGKTTEEAMPTIKDFVENKPDQRVPKGESFNEFKDRAFKGVFNALSSGESPVAIVTHHRVERLLEAWDKAGQPADGTLDLNTFGQKGDAPGGIKKLIVKNSPEAQQMTHSSAITGREPSPILPAMAEKLKSTNDLIGKLMTGEIDPSSEEGIKHVTNLTAATMGMGSFGAERGAAGIFGGRLTTTSKNIAEAFEKIGMDEKAIKGYTGLERGAEGIWRKELNDAESHMSIPTEIYKERNSDGWEFVDSGIDLLQKGDYKLGQILHHPQLFKDYPELKDLDIKVKKQIAGTRGTYHHAWEDNPPRIEMDPGADKDTLLHEIQHAIQDKEGMSIGHLTAEERDQYKGYLLRKYENELGAKDRVSLGHIIDKIEKGETSDAADRAILLLGKLDRATYLNLAHEQEAWNVGRRMNMTAEQRKKSLAKDTETASREDQIKFKGKIAPMFVSSKPYL